MDQSLAVKVAYQKQKGANVKPGMQINVWYRDEGYLGLWASKVVFNFEKGTVKIFSEGKYYIMGFKDISQMRYSIATNAWAFDVTCPLPIGEKDE